MYSNSLEEVYDRNELFSHQLCLPIKYRNIEEVVEVARLARYHRISYQRKFQFREGNILN